MRTRSFFFGAMPSSSPQPAARTVQQRALAGVRRRPLAAARHAALSSEGCMRARVQPRRPRRQKLRRGRAWAGGLRGRPQLPLAARPRAAPHPV